MDRDARMTITIIGLVGAVLFIAAIASLVLGPDIPAHVKAAMIFGGLAFILVGVAGATVQIYGCPVRNKRCKCGHTGHDHDKRGDCTAHLDVKYTALMTEKYVAGDAIHCQCIKFEPEGGA